MILGCENETFHEVLDRLHGGRTRPSCIDLLNRAAGTALFREAGLEAPDAPWVILVGYEGNAAAVHWQVQQLVRELGEIGLDIQAFVGALHGAQASRGIFITTSRFSSEARDYAERVNARLILIDGPELAALMIEHDCGVIVEESFVLKRVDENFFEEA